MLLYNKILSITQLSTYTKELFPKLRTVVKF